MFISVYAFFTFTYLCVYCYTFLSFMNIGHSDLYYQLGSTLHESSSPIFCDLCMYTVVCEAQRVILEVRYINIYYYYFIVFSLFVHGKIFGQAIDNFWIFYQQFSNDSAWEATVYTAHCQIHYFHFITQCSLQVKSQTKKMGIAHSDTWCSLDQ